MDFGKRRVEIAVLAPEPGLVRFLPDRVPDEPETLAVTLISLPQPRRFFRRGGLQGTVFARILCHAVEANKDRPLASNYGRISMISRRFLSGDRVQRL